jgi:hypothetical protein
MPQALRYRTKATELRDKAALAENADIRAELIKVAEQYELLAVAVDNAAERVPDSGVE